MEQPNIEAEQPTQKPGIATKSKKTFTIRKVVALVIILVVIVAGTVLFDRFYSKRAVTTLSKPAVDGNQTLTATEATVASVSEAVSPSVVSIITNITTQTYFGASQQQAAGTGIIVSADGYILTNKHVINGAKSVQIVTADGTTYDNVDIIGTDPLNDVAYLKIKDAKDLPVAQLGDSSTVRVGQSVVAIGNALGQYQNTVTSGIISGLGRPVEAGDSSGTSTETLTDLFQTDASINPGNSGGPLLNMAGQVIGINTAVAQDAQGIGFSIPINATKGTLKGVLAGNGVKRAYLGVKYIQITPEVAKQYNLPVKQGAYVYSSNSVAVMTDGPADKAGIQDKDIITKINGLSIGKNGGVSSLVGAYAPGDTVVVTVLRDGTTRDIKVTLGTYNG